MPAKRLIDTVDPNTLDRISALWDALADFDAAQAYESGVFLLEGVCALIDAWDASWVVAVRLERDNCEDPLNGWRPRAIRRLSHAPERNLMARRQTAELEAGRPDQTTIANVDGAGRYRVNLLRDLAPAGWFEGDYYRTFYQAAGHRDAIWAGVPINEDTEAYFGFYRGVDQRCFSTVETSIVDYALRGLRWFLRQQVLFEGIAVAASPLTRSERSVLQGLLQGRSEQEIAETLGHSPHTTHEYVKKLFRKFGVNSRSALMALWLGRIPPDQGTVGRITPTLKPH